MKKLITIVAVVVTSVVAIPLAVQARDGSTSSGAASAWEGGYSTQGEDDAVHVRKDSYARDAPSEKRVYKKNRFVAAVLAFFLGGVGAHSFYMGHTWTGVIRLSATVLTGGAAAAVLIPISLIECCLYLFSSDEEFNEKYIVNGRSWF